MSRYCRICGKSKPVSLFYRTNSICLDCERLSQAQQDEMQLASMIRDLIYPLSAEQVGWLKGLCSDPREAIRTAAKAAIEQHID